MYIYIIRCIHFSNDADVGGELETDTDVGIAVGEELDVLC